MRAAILSIGDELTLGQNLDTNAPWLAARLMERSIIPIEKRTVPDDRHAIAGAIAELASRADVLIITGGLGPTDDDLTREALGDVATPGQPSETDEQALAQIIKRFERHSRVMPDMNRKQAQRPATFRCLPNPNGTAPGLFGVHHDCVIASLPGPPAEMQPMFFDQVLPALPSDQNGEVILTAAVHEFGMGESDAAQRLGDLMDRNRNPLVGTTASHGIVTARIRASGPADWARQQLENTVELVQKSWTPLAYGRDGKTIADAVTKLLCEQNRSLATAESCTGGWLGKSIVDVPGCSDCYRGGWITYSNEMKNAHLGVPMDLLNRFGAVSEPVALAMASGALERSGADEALSVTGIAGPPRADQPTEKPVGTVYIGHARRVGPGVECATRKFLFPGDRSGVRERTAIAALQILRLALLQAQHDGPLLWELPRNSSNPSKSPAAKSSKASTIAT